MSLVEMFCVRWITLAAAVPLIAGACDAAPSRGSEPPPRPAGVEGAVAAPAAVRRSRPGRVGPAVAVDEAAAFAAIRDWLRRLVVAEESYFAENGTYTALLDSTRLPPPPGVTVTMLWATREGWAARAGHAAIPAKDCVVYVGRSRPVPATRHSRRQAGEGVPVCDATNQESQHAGRSTSRRAGTARAAPPAPGLPDAGSGLDAVSPIVQMKVDLQNLVRSQESWFGTQGAYSRRTEPFAMQYLWHSGVKLRILAAGRDFWSAKATHDRLPGKSCVIWFGPVAMTPRTDGQAREATSAMVPMCDDP